MALSSSMAGAGAGGAGLAMNPGMAFGTNAMAAPAAFSTFEPPPSAPPGAGAGAAAGRSGAGGAYDLRAWEKEEGPREDMDACLGVDIGTSSIKACLYLKDGGCKAIGGKTPLSACVLIDRKTGVKGVRRWLKMRADGGPASPAPPKGVKLFHTVGGGGGGGGSGNGGRTGGDGKNATAGAGMAVVWPLRLLALRGKGSEAMQRVRSSLRHEIKVSSETSTGDVSSSGADDHDDGGDTSGVQVLLTSPDATEAKDREIWCTPEEVLAMLLADVKAKAEDAHKVSVVTCNLSLPSCLGDLHRVALQRSVFLAGMVPGRFVGAPLAAAVGYLWGRSTPELKGPNDLVVSVGMGASFLDVSVIAPTRGEKPSPAEGADASGSGGKKKKGKGKGNKGPQGGGDAEGIEYRVKASAGDSACGGIDMDYLVARALLAAVEDSSGSEVASDRALWRHLLESAKLLRERLSADPKSSCLLKAGCCDADPAFTPSLEISQVEMESAVAGTLDTFRSTLQVALDRAKATAGEVKTVVLYGLCAKTPALLDEVVKMFFDAQIEHPGPGDCAKGAALLLAASRGLLEALPVEGVDTLTHKLGLVDRSKKNAEVTELFAEGSPIPSTTTQQFSRKNTGSGLALDMEVVQWMEGGDGVGGAGKSGKRGSSGGVQGGWVTVQRLGNPLAMQDDSGYPVLAEEVATLFSLDECGICVNEIQSSVLPKKKAGPGPMRRLLNEAAIAGMVFGILGGGYWMLHRLEHAGERRQASARIRLTAFYEQNNPEKLGTVEDALARYKGREDVLFQRLKKQYGKPVPV